MTLNQGLFLVRLPGYSPDPAAVRLLTEDVARRYTIMPLWVENEYLVVACANPTGRDVLKEVAIAARRPVRPLLASYPEIRSALDRIYGGHLENPPTLEFGEALRRLGHLTEDAWRRALTDPAERHESLLEKCLRLGMVNEDALAEALGWQYGLPHLCLESVTPQGALASLVPRELARNEQVVPLWWIKTILVTGTSSPQKDHSRAITKRLGAPVWPVVCPPLLWNRLYRRLYLHGPSAQQPGELSPVDILLKTQVLSESDLTGAYAVAQQTRQALPDVLLERGLVTRQQWLSARSQALGVPVERRARRPSTYSLSLSDLADLVPAPLAWALSILPLGHEDSKLILGMQQPVQELIRFAESLTGLEIQARLLDPVDLQTRLNQMYGNEVRRLRLQPVPALGEFLLAMGIITPDQYAEARKTNPDGDDHLSEHLLNRGYLDDAELAQAISVRTGFPYARLDHAHFEPELVNQVPRDFAQQHQMLPFATFGRDLWVAVADPLDTEGLQFIEARTGRRAMPLIAPRSVIAATVDRFFGEQVIRLDAPIRALIETLIGRGLLTPAGAAQVLQSLVAGTLPLDQAIAQASTLPATEIVKTLAELLAVPLVDLRLREQTVSTLDPLGQPVTRNVARDPVNATAARLLDLETAQRLAALPVARAGNEITVAFADPHFEPAQREIQTLLGLRVRPCLAPRGFLEEAIQRVLGRQNIGTSLLVAGIISRSQLNDALDLAQRTGVRLGRALLNRGYVTEQQLWQFLAEQARLPFFDLRNVIFDEATVRLIDPDTERELGICPIAADAEQVTLAMVDPLNDEALQTAARVTGRMIRPVLVSEQNIELSLERIYGKEYLARSVSELLERAPEDSAYRVLSRGQKIALALFAITSVLGLLLDCRIYVVVLNALSTLFYLSFSTYKFYLINHAVARDLEVPVTDEDLAALNDRDLPIYTILIPAYREAEVLPDLLAALGKLDYPTTKLDIKVLMEADDLETIQAFDQMKLPTHFQGIIVPTAQPQTKPKACNYGLIHARGDYVVMYDAEDLPDPDQLKRVLVAFGKSPPEVACIQCKLNYYNRNQNHLTGWFTVEYSMWFDLFLPGLYAGHAPIPLGGTSNHFKRDLLIESGAWDPYNVTEDADLGMRIFKRGYRTALVDSTTYEEANSEIYNWIRQRSRWIKGYIQTWLVHMRHPLKLYKEIGGKAFWGFQFTVGGTFFAALLNPIYWFLTTLWFMTHWGFIREVFPGIVFYSGALCLYLGNFAFTYLNVAGAMRRGYYDLVKYALLSPLYWGLMSVGAWKGFLQLVAKPYFWEKTKHGLFQGEPSPERADRLRDLV